MLQRAAETVSGDDECNDPAVLLACALGSTGCPAKCADAEKQESTINPYEGVQAGDLNIAVSTSSSVTSIPTNGVIKVAELAVKASENIQLQSLDVTRLGLSQNKGLKVWLEKDGRRITSSSSFFGDSVANLSFNNGGYVVNGNETLDLVVSLSGDAGSELQFKVGNVVSSSKSTSVSPDTTGVFRTANYSVTTISVIEKASNRNYDVAKDASFSFGEFQLINNSAASMEKDAMIKSITFKVNVNGGSIENLSQFKLLKDSKEVSSKYTVDGKSVTFAVNDILESGKSATYKVTAVPTNIETAVSATSNGDAYTLKINKAEDIIAEEVGNNSTAFRAAVKGATSSTDFPTNGVSLGTTTIKGGNFTLTRDSNFASNVNANWGYSDVVIAKGTIKANQAAKFENGITLTVKSSVSATKDFGDIIRRASLKIGSKTYQAAKIEGKGTDAKIVFDSEIYLDKGTHDVELLVSLSNQTDNTIKTIELSDILGSMFTSGKYLNSDETDVAVSQIAGSIKVSKITIAEQKFTFKKTGPSQDVKFVQGTTDEKVLLAGEIINNQAQSLDLNNFIVEVLPTPAPSTKNASDDKLGDIYVAIIDGSTSSTQPLVATANSKVTIDAVSSTIDPDKSVKFELRFIPNANLKKDATFKVSVKVEGKTDGNNVSTSEVNSAAVTVTEKASSTIVAETAKNKIILPGTETEIASFDYTVKNDTTEINSIVLKTNGKYTTAAVDRLDIDFGGSVGRPSLTWTNKDVAGNLNDNYINVKFDNAVTIPVGTHKVRVYAQFAESAIGTSETSRNITDIAINPQSTFDWTTANKAKTDGYVGGLTFAHFVAKAYPVLNRESMSRDVNSPSLELGITKVEGDGYATTVKLTAINGGYSTYNDTSKSYTPASAAVLWKPAVDGNPAVEFIKPATSSVDLANISTSKQLLRSSYHRVHVDSIDFEVTEDNLTTTYAGVHVDTIADFATLTNE